MNAILEQRFVRPGLYGAAVAFGMFWSMHLLIVGGKYVPEDGATLATVDFVRLKKETELETRERRKPPKPEPPKQPPPPKMKVETPPPDAPPTQVALPKLNLPSNITGGPFLGAFTGEGMSGYSELIPLVRIAPQYPRQALRDGIEGVVVFEVTINPDGTVKSAKLLSAKPRGVFEGAAMNAIMKWKFKPKVVEGKGVESVGVQPIDFKMEGETK
jgi:periplasmic protein TonB